VRLDWAGLTGRRLRSAAAVLPRFRSDTCRCTDTLEVAANLPMPPVPGLRRRSRGPASGQLRSTAHAYVHQQGTLQLALPTRAPWARSGGAYHAGCAASTSASGASSAAAAASSGGSDGAAAAAGASDASDSDAGGADWVTLVSPVALAEIPALQRAYPALTQAQAQAAVRCSLEAGGAPGSGFGLQPVPLPALQAALGPGLGPGPGPASSGEGVSGLHSWVQLNIADADVRGRHVARLAAAARPFACEGATRERMR